MMMGDGAAGRNQRVAGCILDGLPLPEQSAVTAERVERKIGCGPVRVDMGEAASDLALHAGRFQDGTLGRGFDTVMKAFEPVPSDGGLERIVDEARRRQKFARIRHTDKSVAPDPCRALAMRVAGLSLLRRAAMVGATLERARHPRVRCMIAGLKAEHHDRNAAVRRTGVESLLRIENAAVRRIEACLRDGTHGARRIEKRRKTDRRTAAEFRTRLQSHPGARNHAERSFRADEQAIRTGACT